MKIERSAQPQTPPVTSERDEALKGLSKQFEAVFVNQMVTAMRNTVLKGGLIPESQGERIYQGMLDQEHAQKISESGELGLSNLIYQHLVRSAGG